MRSYQLMLEKAFDNIQCLFLIKALRKKIEENHSTWWRASTKKRAVNKLYDERLKAGPLTSRTKQG